MMNMFVDFSPGTGFYASGEHRRDRNVSGDFLVAAFLVEGWLATSSDAMPHSPPPGQAFLVALTEP